jgi:hypothetical protein
VSERDWDKELARIDKQLESVSDAQLFPEKTKPGAATPPGGASASAGAAVSPRVAADRAAARSWPAILRLTLSVLLGVGILFWPYENRCGIGLTGYLIAVAAVVGSGVWSAVWTWRHNAARAHILSILLVAWGVMLGAAEVLPRIGYAKQVLTWSCAPLTIR